MKSIIFIGTPHHGSDLAVVLKKILAVTFSNKEFVKQLQSNSESLAEINRLFGDRAGTLNLVSFYESKGVRALGVLSNMTLLTKDHRSRVRRDTALSRGNELRIGWRPY